MWQVTLTPIDLIVVANIIPIGDPDTFEVASAGGLRRVWTDWTPLQSDLRALHMTTRFPLCRRERPLRGTRVQPGQRKCPSITLRTWTKPSRIIREA
jgi:hypothetical protein